LEPPENPGRFKATHTHHYDDEHEGALQVEVSDEQGSQGSAPVKGMTHDHGPSHSYASPFVTPDETLTISSMIADQLLFDRYASVHSLARGDTLLRPPRIA
jgi:hypothetical protein